MDWVDLVSSYASVGSLTYSAPGGILSLSL